MKSGLTEREALGVMLGRGGSTVINDTSLVSGDYTAITFISDTVFTTLTDVNRTGSIAGMIFPAGLTIFGSFTEIQLASGSCIAYKV